MKLNGLGKKAKAIGEEKRVLFMLAAVKLIEHQRLSDKGRGYLKDLYYANRCRCDLLSGRYSYLTYHLQ